MNKGLNNDFSLAFEKYQYRYRYTFFNDIVGCFKHFKKLIVSLGFLTK